VKDKIIRKLSLWLPPVLWAVLIFHFSSGTIPVASAVYWQDFTIKKTGHVLLFGVLAILTFRALRGEGIERKKALIWAIIIATLYGATDEFHQMFTQGRESRVRDVFIDQIGAIIATYLTYVFLPKLPKKLRIYAEELNLI